MNFFAPLMLAAAPAAVAEDPATSAALASKRERIARLAEAWRTVIDRETWFELWTLAAGQEVP